MNGKGKGLYMKRALKVVGVVLILLIIGSVIYWMVPYSPAKQKFQKRMQKRVEELGESKEVCSQEEIQKLPKPLQKYCKYIGLENTPKYKSVNAFFEDTDFVFDTKSEKVMKMDYDLWLFNEFDGKTFRSAFCSASMYGIPFEGEDYATEDNQGGMRGILAKSIQIFDVRDEQGYKAGLISWLVECSVINPSALLSPAISYKELDDTHVEATISANGVTGSGIFTFNEEGAITEFYSDERQVEEIDGEKIKMGWRCICENYEMQNGIKIPTKIASIKIFPDGKELVYFAAEDYRVQYD